MSYTDTTGKLAQLTRDECVRIVTAYDAGRLTRDELVELLVVTLTVRADEAAQLADLALATQLSELRRRIVPTLGLAADPDTAAAVRPDVVAAVADPDPTYAVGVLAAAVVLSTGQETFHDGMVRHDVTLWRRVPNSGACEVCMDLASGAVDIDEHMWTHKGCGCTSTPIN